MRHLAALTILAALALPASALGQLTAVKDTTPPTVKLGGLPAATTCAKSVKVRFDISDPAGVRFIRVYLDRVLVGSHSPGTGALKIKFPKTLKPGWHRLGVRARDNAGNLALKVVNFRLCT